MRLINLTDCQVDSQLLPARVEDKLVGGLGVPFGDSKEAERCPSTILLKVVNFELVILLRSSLFSSWRLSISTWKTAKASVTLAANPLQDFFRKLGWVVGSLTCLVLAAYLRYLQPFV